MCNLRLCPERKGLSQLPRVVQTVPDLKSTMCQMMDFKRVPSDASPQPERGLSGLERCLQRTCFDYRFIHVNAIAPKTLFG